MVTTIGVIGGGISGLATAFHLARRIPTSFPAKIILFEKSKRLGGWIRSETVHLTLPSKNGSRAHSIVLEAGPRTLRPKSLDMLELVHLLGLEPLLELIPYSHPAALNRYVYFPETGLTRLPSGILSLLSSQFTHRASLGAILPSVLREPFKSPNRPAGATDESFDDFISRRFGLEFARRFGSSLIHGIYATDSRQLSIRASFGQLWDAEERGGGSVVRGMIMGSKQPSSESGFALGSMKEVMKGVSVFKFKGGMESLSRALERSLRNDRRVEIRTRDGVHELRPSDGTPGVTVVTSSKDYQLSRLVSTLPLPKLSALLPEVFSIPHTTVHVVNLVFAPTSFPIHPPGFGYLVPRPNDGYPSATSPILGCVFDSVVPSNNSPTIVTLMLGGPFPIQPTPLSPDTILAMLASQLGQKTLPQPIAFRYHIQKSCIPTLLVGHLDRVSKLRRIIDQEWGGRLQVIGAGMGGPSLGDCVRDGRAAAIRIARELGFP